MRTEEYQAETEKLAREPATLLEEVRGQAGQRRCSESFGTERGVALATDTG